jgi:thermitase
VRFTVTRRGTNQAVASWSIRARASQNSITITRKLPTGRTLKPGAYTLDVAVSTAARSSRLIRVP